MMKGETISEIAAFSSSTGEWATQRLLNPTKEQICPVVGTGLVLFQEGNNFYAFSAGDGPLGRAQLPGGEKPRAAVSSSDITVQQGNKIYVFPLKLAKWSKGIAMKPVRSQQQPANVPGP